MAFVAKCTKCGKLDQRKSYSSADDAAKQGAFTKWTCPTCAWTEFELMDEAAEATEATPANA